MHRLTPQLHGTGLLLLGLLLAVSTPGVEAQEPYRLPPEEILQIVDAPPAPRTSVSPDHQWLLLIDRSALPPIEDLARPMLRLAGMRIDPAANGSFRTSYDEGLRLRPLRDPEAEPIRIPIAADGRLASTRWSHLGDRFVYTVVTSSGTELWGVEVSSPTNPRLLATGLNTIFVAPRWLPDGTSILCSLVPEDRGEAPKPPTAPSGPNVQETSGSKSPVRTYQDLLKSEHDGDLFEHYGRSVLTVIPWRGEPSPLGPTGLISAVDVSPDGENLLVEELLRPWSYSLPHWQFARESRVLDREGETLHRWMTPMVQDVPIGGVPLGPRSVQWHPMRPATLLWVEALDGGDPRAEVSHRDRWMAHESPFTAATVELQRLEHRARGIDFFRSPTHFVFGEYDRDRRWIRRTMVDVAHPEKARVIEDRSVRDRYGDPGALVMEDRPDGISVILQRGDWVFRTGAGAGPDGVFPFVRMESLTTGETRPMWRCEDGAYETPLAVWEEEGAIQVLTSHESPTSPPNLRWHTVEGESRVLTRFEDPTPAIRAVKKELLTYDRADGVPLSGTLYTPADHRPGVRLPLLVWAYPREYNDPGTAGQIGVSPHRFTRIAGSSHLHLVTQGYAVLDGATMPIIGDAETMNDSFIEQLVASAEAAIDTVVERGVADRRRIAVGGHSYGAFMTANLLAHCDLFRAGLARSGAYNRTLTPFGFQSERRTLWEAPESYFAISPFMHADRIDEPLLLIHGEVDNNSGTYPMQSRRLFAAIQGNGGTARLVMLPHESHGYRARESVLHTLAEMVDWLDRHLTLEGDPSSDAGG
ncbi:MAG: alpha/beta hydrolase family protein [Planctomycetota bacterium]